MDEFEDVEGFARRNRRRTKILAAVALGIFAIPLVWVGYSYHERQKRIERRHEENRKALELAPDDIASLKKSLAETKARIAVQHEAWKRVVTHEELAKLQPSASPCEMPRMQGEYVQRESIGASYFKGNPGRIPAGEAFGLPYRSVLANIETLEKKLAGGTANRNDVSSYDLENAIAFIVVEKESKPIATGGGFISGEIVGRGYVYSASAQRITCVANLAVKNSDALQIDYQYMAGNYADREYKENQAAEWKLAQELEANVVKALAAELRAVN